MIRTTRTRRGVTLVEMMVAAALCILGMWLLVWVYQQGLDSFRNGRANADLTASERMVTSLMTRDLRADHFLEEDGKPNRGRRLSDQRPDQAGYKPPKSGYYWTKSTTTGTVYDDTVNSPAQSDSNGFYYTRSAQHFAQFTVILPGGTNAQTFGVEVPAYSGTQYFGTAAEVSYYLVKTGKTPNGLVDVFDLYRGQRLAARTTDDAPAYAAAVDIVVKPANADAPEVMAVDTAPNPRRMRALSALGVQANRLVPYSPLPATSARFGEDKLMSGVLSLEIKYTGTGANWPTPFGSGNTDFPYDFLPMTGSAPGEFDTHGSTGGSLKAIRITGVQIRIRAMDVKTLTTRQTTFTVDL